MTNKTVCKIFVAIAFVIFVDTTSITDMISSYSITKVLPILFKY